MHSERFKIQRLLLKFYKEVPFHNLWLLARKRLELPDERGGTCTDKTLYFQRILKENGFHFRLHNAFINNRPCHRVLLGEIDKKPCVIDVGDGNPLITPLFFGENREFTHYGYKFIQKSSADRIEIYQIKKQEAVLNFYVENKIIPEREIWEAIEKDFKDDKINPFHRTLRFALVVKNKFYRIEDNILKIGDKRGIKKIQIKNLKRLKFLFEHVFHYDFNHVLKGLQILNERGIKLWKEIE